MKNKVYNKSLLFTLFISVVVVFNINCGKQEGKTKTVKNVTELDTIPVKVARVELKDIKLEKVFTGSLEGEEQANIVSKIPERIVKINARVGQHVNSGEILLVLDKSGASSQYFQAQAGFKNAEKDLNRMKALYEAGAISQQMLDGTQTAYDISKANFEAAKATVELVAPISGIVTSVNVNIGDLAQPGIVLSTIASINNMKILFDAGESDIQKFAIGQPAEIYSELKPELVRKGRIFQISKSAEVVSRSFEIKASFRNAEGNWFKPGMFCRVRVILMNKQNVLLVPSAAITNINNTASVFVVNNGRAYFKNIQVGITNGTNTEIINGLKEGETVVTLGMNNLKNGTVVYVSDM